MSNLGGNYEWERWRGSSNERMDDLEEHMKIVNAWKDDTSRRIAILETKMIVFAAAAAAIGSMIPGAFAAVAKYLGGQ